MPRLLGYFFVGPNHRLVSSLGSSDCHLGLIRETPERCLAMMPGDCGRHRAMTRSSDGVGDQRSPSIGRVTPLSFLFVVTLLAGPGAILFGVTPLIRGNQSEACAPPCTFCSPNHSSGRGIDIEFKLYW
jgi:hypothetical protein